MNKVFVRCDAFPEVRTKIFLALPINVARKDVTSTAKCCERRPVDSNSRQNGVAASTPCHVCRHAKRFDSISGWKL